MATGRTGGSFWGKQTPPGNALLAKEQAATARQAAGLNPSVTPAQIGHSILNGLGINPRAILHNAAVVGSNTLPPQAGVNPQSVSQISQAGIPVIGPGGLGHAGALAVLPFKRLIGRAAEDIAAHEVAPAAVKVARTSVDASAHVAEASARAMAEGHGIAGIGGRGNAPLLKPGEVTAATGGEAGAKVRAALQGKHVLNPENAGPVAKPYVSSVREGVGGPVANSIVGSRGYVYHATTADNLDSIARSGLTPAESVGAGGTKDLKGVYFSGDPLVSQHLIPKGKVANSVFLRARRENIPGLDLHPTKAYGEELTPHSVPPSSLEYLGEDQQWHPLAGNPSALGQYEKVGAKLDDPSFGQSAAQARTAQKALQHEGRVKQAGRLRAAHEGATGVDALEAGRAAMRGELGHVTWNGIQRNLDQGTFNEVINHALNHPALQTFEHQTVGDAIKNAWEKGIVPAQHENDLIDRVFGKEAPAIKDALKTSAYWKTLGVDALNLPRAVMASTDLSAPLRQGLVYGVSHPVMFAKTFTPMMKAAVKEGYFQSMIQDEIHARPTFPLMEKAKVAFTDIGKDAKHGAASLGAREEARMSNLAERIPVWGRVIRGSDRAYVGFLNKARADYFDRLINLAAKQGLDVNDPKLLESIGKVINTATGRGNVPKALQNHLATMNALFFSPRLLASRVNLLNPLYYYHLEPFARREALRNIAALGGTALTILELARLAGAQVKSDPRNADFGKIRMGNTRLDILGGFQQPIRLGAQLYTGTIISSTTGKKIKLAGGFANTSRYDVTMRFLQSKLSPIPSLVVELGKGQTFDGKPLTAKSEIVQRTTPLLAQDIWSLYHTPGSGGLKAIPEAGLGIFGVGVQSYAPKTPKGSGPAGFWDQGGSSGSTGSTGGSSSFWGKP